MTGWDDCEWSRSRYFSFIRSGLRRLWSKYPVKYKVLNEARRKYKGDDKRTKWEYQCAHCSNWFKAKEVQVDHIEPAGSLKDYSDLPKFVSTLFCGKENLQVLCSKGDNNCHSIKTKREREERKMK